MKRGGGIVAKGELIIKSLFFELLAGYTTIVFMQFGAITVSCLGRTKSFKDLLFPFKQWKDYLNPFFIIGLIRKHYDNET